MKNASIYLVFGVFLTTICFGQGKIVDPDNPIANIDINYSVNNTLIVTVLLNSKDNTQNLASNSIVNFRGTVEGQINWNAPSAGGSDNYVKGTFVAASTETPFKFTADIKNG
ncbi:MAG: hypothetical protein RIE86_19550, partial [Imperialibacter sp.]|uniref:hypothetical protein n=1 Tax=Imperialibacter sp. TaxID=2038411 RepID=UPI0032EFA0C3